MGNAKNKLKKKLTDLQVMKLYDDKQDLIELLYDLVLNYNKNDDRFNAAFAQAKSHLKKYGYTLEESNYE